MFNLSIIIARAEKIKNVLDADCRERHSRNIDCTQDWKRRKDGCYLCHVHEKLARRIAKEE